MFFFGSDAIALLLSSGGGLAFSTAVAYLRLVSLFYTVCFLGNAFTGHYSGMGRVMLPFIGTLGHIGLRVVLSWALFPRLGLNAVALATGLGWLCGVAFWAGCNVWLRSRT